MTELLATGVGVALAVLCTGTRARLIRLAVSRPTLAEVRSPGFEG